MIFLPLRNGSDSVCTHRCLRLSWLKALCHKIKPLYILEIYFQKSPELLFMKWSIFWPGTRQHNFLRVTHSCWSNQEFKGNSTSKRNWIKSSQLIRPWWNKNLWKEKLSHSTEEIFRNSDNQHLNNNNNKRFADATLWIAKWNVWSSDDTRQQDCHLGDKLYDMKLSPTNISSQCSLWLQGVR